MAGNWRIRHKLMLGMALVVAIMAFLLAGTLKGLASYKATMSTFDSKLDELDAAEALKDAVKSVGLEWEHPRRQTDEMHVRLQKVRQALANYQDRLHETVAQQRGNDGFREVEQVRALEEKLQQVEEALHRTENTPQVAGPHGMHDFDLLATNSPVRLAVESLLRCASDLILIINGDLRDRIRESRHEYRSSVTILVSTSVLAVLMMVGLLRFFYRWVVVPIRALELGVSRVAHGDFEHRIQIQSGDEMQDLAEAYNGMSEKLHEMYSNLAEQVNERSRQLVRSERMAGVGFLAAGVAHEINNPLASIAFCSEALERRVADLYQGRAEPQDHDTVKKYLKMIQEEAFRCKEITQRLLAYSRGGDRKRQATNLADVLQGVIDMVQHLQSSRGKRIDFQAGESIPAWANAQEVKQVFLNLVINALDSMDEGGVLSISHAVEDGMVELAFTDTGCGMTADVLENIFEPFFTRSRTGKGTGLGLSISHRIIAQHGGEIEASSAGAGQGSTFRVRLPIDAPVGLHDEPGDEVLDPEEEFLKLSSAKTERRAA